jgi:hypothetical protein
MIRPGRLKAIFRAGHNFLLKPGIDPSSNDNDPMWLNKAA